jgi:hypothetical protein
LRASDLILSISLFPNSTRKARLVSRWSAALPRRASLHFEVHAFCLPLCSSISRFLEKCLLPLLACTRHSRPTYILVPSPPPPPILLPPPHNHGCRPPSHCWPAPGQSRPAAEQTGHVANASYAYIIDTHLTHVSAEQALKAQESTPGFSLALLQIVNTDSFPQATRLAAALFFKNFVRRNWVVRDGGTWNTAWWG